MYIVSRSARVRHLRTQTESSGCAPDSLKSSGLSRSAWAPRPPSLFETKSQLVSPCSPHHGRAVLGAPMAVRQSGLGTKNYQVSTALNYKLKLYEQTTNLQNCCDGCDGPADLPRHRPRANILQRNAYHYHAKPVLSTWRHLSRHPDQDGRDLRCIEEMMD